MVWNEPFLDLALVAFGIVLLSAAALHFAHAWPGFAARIGVAFVPSLLIAWLVGHSWGTWSFRWECSDTAFQASCEAARENWGLAYAFGIILAVLSIAIAGWRARVRQSSMSEAKEVFDMMGSKRFDQLLQLGRRL